MSKSIRLYFSARRLAAMIAIVGSFFACLQAFACCSLQPARFFGTLGWVGEAHKNGKLIHILAYENTVQNLAVVNGKPVGNAMFLPIPAVPNTMTEANILDTSEIPRFLHDMKDADDSKRLMGATGMGSPVKIFEHGIYTIVLATNPTDIPAALAKVPERKRPNINQGIFTAYSKWYPGWTFALCCFDTREAVDANPMLWWYEPTDPKHLFFPGLDCHTGAVPDLKAKVDVDHFIAISSDSRKRSTLPAYELGVVGATSWIGVGYKTGSPSSKNKSAEAKRLLPDKILSTEYQGTLPQGDFIFDVAKVREGKPEPAKRQLPPGAVSIHK